MLPSERCQPVNDAQLAVRALGFQFRRGESRCTGMPAPPDERPPLLAPPAPAGRTGGGSQSWSARGSTEAEPSTLCHVADVLMWECSFGLPPGRSWEETPDGSNSAASVPVPSPPRGHPAGSPATAESQASLQAWHGRCTDQWEARSSVGSSSPLQSEANVAPGQVPAIWAPAGLGQLAPSPGASAAQPSTATGLLAMALQSPAGRAASRVLARPWRFRRMDARNVGCDWGMAPGAAAASRAWRCAVALQRSSSASLRLAKPALGHASNPATTPPLSVLLSMDRHCGGLAMCHPLQMIVPSSSQVPNASCKPWCRSEITAAASCWL